MRQNQHSDAPQNYPGDQRNFQNPSTDPKSTLVEYGFFNPKKEHAEY